VGEPTECSLGVGESSKGWSIVAKMAEEPKNLDRWLGDGGMVIVGALGGSFEAYGVDGEDLGWVDGSFVPSELACNPHGSVQAGVHGVLLDAAMNFAINAALRGRDRTEATIEMTSELMRPALRDEHYVLRGEVVRLTRQIAYAEATIAQYEGKLVSRATGTFLVHREGS
jgi:uncharacterized protein (TIGR00369 family)